MISTSEYHRGTKLRVLGESIYMMLKKQCLMLASCQNKSCCAALIIGEMPLSLFGIWLLLCLLLLSCFHPYQEIKPLFTNHITPFTYPKCKIRIVNHFSTQCRYCAYIQWKLFSLQFEILTNICWWYNMQQTRNSWSEETVYSVAFRISNQVSEIDVS